MNTKPRQRLREAWRNSGSQLSFPKWKQEQYREKRALRTATALAEAASKQANSQNEADTD